MARYCSLAVWGDDYERFSTSVHRDGVRIASLVGLVRSWLGFRLIYDGLRFAEWTADSRASLVKLRAWSRGLGHGGFRAAHDAAAGLQIT